MKSKINIFKLYIYCSCQYPGLRPSHVNHADISNLRTGKIKTTNSVYANLYRSRAQQRLFKKDVQKYAVDNNKLGKQNKTIPLHLLFAFSSFVIMIALCYLCMSYYLARSINISHFYHDQTIPQ